MMGGPRPVSLPVHTWMVAYDILDAKRRVRIAKALKGFGERVQFSVFELRLDDNELAKVRKKILSIVDQKEDSIRWYPLCGPCLLRITQQGEGSILEDEGYYVV